MRATSSLALTICVVSSIGCGDAGGGTGSTDTAGSTSATSGDATGTSSATDGTPTSTEPPGTSTEPPGTSSGASTTDASTTDASTGGTTEEDPGTSTGGAIDCQALSPGPFVAELFLEGFEGSEDLAFDGSGGLALKRGGDVVIVRADKSETTLTQGLPQAYGTRYLVGGPLLVALPMAGKVIAVGPQGDITDFLPGLNGPNGVYPDVVGAVWISQFGADRVVRVDTFDMKLTTIVEGPDADAANGVVFDHDRSVLFYTKYLAGEVMRVAIDGQGEADGAPTLVTKIDGAALDGLTLDICGNVYAVDQGNDRVYRVLLDFDGAAVADPTLLAELPSNVANAQFGVGEGFDDHSLYLSGNPGDVYKIALEFPGAPNPTVP